MFCKLKKSSNKSKISYLIFQSHPCRDQSLQRVLGKELILKNQNRIW